MEPNQFFNLFTNRETMDLGFKIIAILLAFFYLLYSLVLGKQVQIMDKALTDKFNQLIFFICSLQTTIAAVLLIFSLFLI